MPRINSVKAARKPAKCNRCGKPIEIGQGYIYWEFRFGGTIKRCLACPRPRQSELTQSDKKSALYAAAESVEDAIQAYGNEEFETTEDFEASTLSEALRSAAEEVRGVGEQYQEAADAIPVDGSPVKDECEEKASACEEWADNLDTAADEVEAVEAEEVEQPESVVDGYGMSDEEWDQVNDMYSAYTDAVQEAIEAAKTEAVEKADNAISDTPDFL